MKLFTLLTTTALALTTATTAFAEIKEFRVGILGGENESDRLTKNQCLADRFEELLGVPVKLYPAADYAGIIEGFLGGTLDYAELGASGFAAIYLEDPEAVEVIGTTVQTDGSTGYVSVLVSRSDSGIETLEDMKGKKLGFADPNSTSGYLVPSVALPQQGYDINEFFGETVFSGGHEQNVLAVINGDVDAGVTWASGVGDWDEGYTSGNLRKMVEKGILDMNDLNLLWTSPEIPNGPVVQRKALPADVKEKVSASWLSMPEDNPDCFAAIQGGDYSGATKVDESFYQFVIDMRKAKLGQ